MTDFEEAKLALDPVIKRIVIVLDIDSLSILELLEYGLTRKDISHALASEVIEIDKATKTAAEHDYLVSGDVYFYEFLNSRVRLTDLGKSLLERIKNDSR